MWGRIQGWRRIFSEEFGFRGGMGVFWRAFRIGTSLFHSPPQQDDFEELEDSNLWISIVITLGSIMKKKVFTSNGMKV